MINENHAKLIIRGVFLMKKNFYIKKINNKNIRNGTIE